ncbi:SIMPL domain-containing protein [Amorphus sp. 3PC139-8]|uniref:SIMPL domain-containing protein n=1 Tax=Amorphus sp. 3PC139-8 TaxID=2735676 RepID=UPI00345D4ACA
MRLAPLAAVTLAAVLAVSAVPAFARDTANLTVTGTGTAAGTPDMATVSVGTVTEAASAGDALSENSSQVQAVIDAVKGAGIEARDIQTSGFSVSPRYTNPGNDSNEAPKIDGYRVTNGVTVRVRQLDTLGGLLDTLVKAGANDVSGIQFAISNTDKLEDTARTAAVADAKHKAALYAEAAGVRLGRVLAITEGGNQEPRPMPMMRMEASAMSVPVEAGEQSLSAQVRIVYEILAE